jgi:cytochrome c peroxidase
MRKITYVATALFACVLVAVSCSKKTDEQSGGGNTPTEPYPAIKAAFGTNINPDNWANYAGQAIPAYIRKDNTGANAISNVKASVGRVLFYDKNLSIDNTISCASCHQQQFGFSDTSLASAGVAGGRTGRHSMRLINARFAVENRFFWNERAATLEAQTTQPIQDHAEMGFSGQNGRPGIAVLLTKLQNIGYYNELFKLAYGDVNVTEARMQECMAQFIRSIQSFDSKYDAGRAAAANDGQPFANFTAQENQGKNLFLTAPQFGTGSIRTGGGLGCNACHNAPEFDINPNSGNNGVIGLLNNTGIDIGNTRSPSLRDLVRTNGQLNGPMMHNGAVTNLPAVLAHYNDITIAPGNNNLDPRLRPNGAGQKLNLTTQEVDAVVSFLRTLSGTSVYTDVKWGNPFL